MCDRQRRELPETSWPATQTRPDVGLVIPASRRIVVVLPAPLGPRKPKADPSSTLRSSPSRATKLDGRQNRAVQGHLLDVSPRYGAVLGHRNRVAHHSVVGHDDDLFHEALDESPALRQLALVEEHAHVQGVGRDGLHVVQDLSAVGEHRPRLLRRSLQFLLPLPVLSDAGFEVVDVQVGGLRQVVEPSQPALHVRQLRLDGFQLLPLLLCHPVHLLVHHLHQRTDVGLGEHVLSNLAHHLLLEAAGVEPGGVAGPAATLHDRLADVVGELPALGVLAGERPVARLAPDQPTEEVGASHPAGMASPGSAGAQLPVHPAEPGLGYDGGEGLLHPHRVRLVLGVGSPDQSSGVRLVPQDDVDAVLGPEPAGGVGDPLVVEGSSDVQDSPAGLGHPEDALHHGRGGGIGFQGGPLLGSVLHHELPVAVGHATGHPESPRSRLTHPPRDLLGKDICYSIDTKSLGIRGGWDLKPVDHDYEVMWIGYEFSISNQH